MANFQTLDNVCNGGHIHDLYTISNENDLKRAMRSETKAILIVSPDQTLVLKVLRKLSKKKTGLRSQRLGRWSSTSTLWMVRC